MNQIIDSNYIQLCGKKRLPWNKRLLPDASIFLAGDKNEVRKKHILKFKEACDKKDIELKARLNCICGGRDLKLISTTDRFGLEFSCYICSSCGLMMTSPYIDPGSLEIYYQNYYHPIHFGSDDLDNSKALFRMGQGEKIFHFLMQFISQCTNLNVLEIGFGTGNVLIEFKENADESHITVEELGTEFNMDCLAKARKIGLNVIKGSLKEVSFRKLKFDLIILSHVLEHFVDIQKELEYLKSIMKSGALVYIEVPGVMTLHKKVEYSFDFMKYFTHAHAYHFNLTSLTQIMNKNGFILIKGNEEIEAVFKTGVQHVDANLNYQNIIDYLSLLENIRNDIYDMHQKFIQAENDMKKKDLQLLKSQKRLHEIQNTWSWKLTSPLRRWSRILINKT